MALRSFRDRNPVVLGITSLIVLGLVLLTAYLIGTQGLLQPGYSMSGVFTDTGGLRSGDAVRVAGVRVGEITSVKPDFERTQVIITWKVGKGIKLGPQTRAEIKMANVLGGRFLRLSGPVAEPYMHERSERLRRIPSARTAVPITVTDAVKSATRTIQRLDATTLNKVIAELNGISRHGRGRQGNVLAPLLKFNETLNENDPQIRQVLDNVDRVNRLIAAKDKQLSTLLTQAQGVLAELRARQAELRQVLGGGSAAVRNTAKLIDEQQKQILTIAADLQQTLPVFASPNPALNSALAWLGPAATGLSGIVAGYGPWAEIAVTGLGPLSPRDLAALLPPRRTTQEARR